MTEVLRKGRKEKTRHTGEESSEDGGRGGRMCPAPTGRQGLPLAKRTGGGRGTDSAPETPEGTNSVNTWIPDFGLHNCERINS